MLKLHVFIQFVEAIWNWREIIIEKLELQENHLVLHESSDRDFC